MGHSTSLGFFPVWQLPSCNSIIIAAHTDDVLTHGAGAGDGDFLRGRLTLRGRGGAGAGAGDLGRGAGAGICRGGDRDGLGRHNFIHYFEFRYFRSYDRSAYLIGN